MWHNRKSLVALSIVAVFYITACNSSPSGSPPTPYPGTSNPSKPESEKASTPKQEPAPEDEASAENPPPEDSPTIDTSTLPPGNSNSEQASAEQRAGQVQQPLPQAPQQQQIEQQAKDTISSDDKISLDNFDSAKNEPMEPPIPPVLSKESQAPVSQLSQQKEAPKDNLVVGTNNSQEKAAETFKPVNIEETVPDKFRSLAIFSPDYRTEKTTKLFANYMVESDVQKQDLISREIAKDVISSEPEELRAKLYEIRLAVDQMSEQKMIDEPDRQKLKKLNEVIAQEIDSDKKWQKTRRYIGYSALVGATTLVAMAPSATTVRTWATKSASIFSRDPIKPSPELLEWYRALDEGANAGKWERLLRLKEAQSAPPPLTPEYRATLTERAAKTGNGVQLENILKGWPESSGPRSWPIDETLVNYPALKRGDPAAIAFYEKLVKDMTSLENLDGVTLQAIDSADDAARFMHFKDVEVHGTLRRNLDRLAEHAPKVPEKVSETLENAVHVVEDEISHVTDKIHTATLKFQPTAFEGVDAAFAEGADGARVVLRFTRPSAAGASEETKSVMEYVGISRSHPDISPTPVEGDVPAGITGDIHTREAISKIADRIKSSVSESVSGFSATGTTRTGLRMQQLSNGQVRAIQLAAGGLTGLGGVLLLDSMREDNEENAESYDVSKIEKLMQVDQVNKESAEAAK